MGVARVQEFFIERRLVSQQQEPLAVGIQTPQWIDATRKIELGEGAMRGAVGSKLGDDAERFVEGNEHFLQNKAIMELA